MFIPSLLAIVAESQRLLSMPEIFGSNPATCLCLQLIAFKRRKQTKREVEISPFLKHIVPTMYQHFLVTIQSVYIIFLEFPKRNKEGLKRTEGNHLGCLSFQPISSQWTTATLGTMLQNFFAFSIMAKLMRQLVCS